VASRRFRARRSLGNRINNTTSRLSYLEKRLAPKRLKAQVVTADKISQAAVTAPTIAPNAVTNVAIDEDAVDTPNIVDNAITQDKIAANSVTAREIAAGTITADEIAANSITTNEIAANTITADDIAANTITANEIAANTITAAEIAADTITANEIAANAITTSELAANSVTSNEIAANTITAADIAANTITAAEIAANTITAAEIAANTITAAEIAANTITANEIAANAITVSELAANAVTADKISANAIDGKVITGALIRTAASGNSIVLDNATNSLTFNNAGSPVGHILPLSTAGVIIHRGGAPDGGGGTFPQIFVGTTNIFIAATNITQDWISVINGVGVIIGSNLSVNNDLTVSGRVFLQDTTTTTELATAHIRLSDGRVRRGASSSARYKEDIQSLTSVEQLDPHKLLSLPVRSFKFKDTYLESDDIRSSIDVPGFIAEEVAEHYPIAADTVDGQAENWNDRYIVPGLLALIQELYARVEALEQASGSSTE
jgi:hypothetical protein